MTLTFFFVYFLSFFVISHLVSEFDEDLLLALANLTLLANLFVRLRFGLNGLLRQQVDDIYHSFGRVLESRLSSFGRLLFLGRLLVVFSKLLFRVGLLSFFLAQPRNPPPLLRGCFRRQLVQTLNQLLESDRRRWLVQARFRGRLLGRLLFDDWSLRRFDL